MKVNYKINNKHIIKPIPLNSIPIINHISTLQLPNSIHPSGRIQLVQLVGVLGVSYATAS